ncbi:NUDIX hydrolase [Psychrilyobacter atlanticus]|uniref:NUDIX hydrolase n=1 Tax=Psychrilyobacter atlanticus TaxID=271091 RepID=UPI00040B7D68|nr:NUDIX domain-containing protein [Psychrilyobacter atlanticus]
MSMIVKKHIITNVYKKYAVIITYENGKLLLVKHKERETWEIPGGHHETGETLIETAKRELFEETGATDFDIKHLFDYSVEQEDHIDYGGVFEANIKVRNKNLNYEISKVKIFDELPPINEMTHGDIQTKLFNYFKGI